MQFTSALGAVIERGHNLGDAMPFMLYAKAPIGTGTRYSFVSGVSLAGRRAGLIYRALRARVNTSSDLKWTLSESELLSADGRDESSFALLSDITPARKRQVNLLEIKAISGCARRTWTPIMIRFERLLKGRTAEGQELSAKRVFDCEQNSEDVVHTFLYLRGGYESGTWNFGPVGRVNSPLLSKDVLAYFLEQAHPWVSGSG